MAWGERVIRQLVERGHVGSTPIVPLAGARYSQPLADWLGAWAIVPMGYRPTTGVAFQGHRTRTERKLYA